MLTKSEEIEYRKSVILGMIGKYESKEEYIKEKFAYKNKTDKELIDDFDDQVNSGFICDITPVEMTNENIIKVLLEDMEEVEHIENSYEPHELENIEFNESDMLSFLESYVYWYDVFKIKDNLYIGFD